MGLVALSDDIQIVKALAIDFGAADRRLFNKQIDELIEKLNDFTLSVAAETKQEFTEVACEFPEFFANQRGFHTAAGGDLVQMSFCVGRVAGYAEHVLGAKFTPVRVTIWKGQLPKDVVISRIRKKIDASKLTRKPSHDWDACGIALYVKGKF